MEKQQKRLAAFRYQGLVVLFLWAAQTAPAQTADLVLQGDRFKIGDRITLDIRVTESDSAKVSAAPLTLPAPLGLSAGPFIRPGIWKVSDQQVTGTLVSYTLTVKTDGVVEIGPITLRVEGKGEVRTGTRNLYLLKPDEAGRRYPLEYSWNLAPGPYYEFQAIPLSYEIKNLGYLPALKEIPLAVPGNALLERTTAAGGIKVTQMGDESLFQVPYDSWVIIPLKPGVLQVPPTAYQLDELRRTTLPLRLEVRPLPQELRSTRAVGNFLYSADLRSRTLAMGEELVVILELKGSGNFPSLQFPEVSLAGFTLLSQDVVNDFSPSGQGYTGTKRILTRFSAQRPGPQTVTLPGYAWLMPEGERIFTQEPKDLSVTVTPGSASSRPQQERRPLLDWEAALRFSPQTFHRSPWSWAAVLPGLLFFLFSAVRRALRRLMAASIVFLLLGNAAEPAPPREFTRSSELYGEKKYQEAAVGFEKMLEDYPDNPGVLYNLALSREALGQKIPALQALRRSLGLGLKSSESAALLKDLEASLGLKDQWDPAPLFDPFLLWLLAVLFVNGGFIAGGVGLLGGRKSFFAAAAVIALAAGAMGYLQYTVEDHTSGPSGIVAGSPSALRRVPGSKAEDWMNLPGGTSVRISGFNKGYVLVRTGYGLEGWMSDRDILRTDWSYFSR